MINSGRFKKSMDIFNKNGSEQAKIVCHLLSYKKSTYYKIIQNRGDLIPIWDYKKLVLKLFINIFL